MITATETGTITVTGKVTGTFIATDIVTIYVNLSPVMASRLMAVLAPVMGCSYGSSLSWTA